VRPPVPNRLLTLVLAVAGGLLTDAAFPDRNQWALAYLGVGFLYVALQRRSIRWNALVGLAWGLAFFPLHIDWSQFAAGTVAWLALSLAESVFVAALGVAWTLARGSRRLDHNGWWDVVAFPVLFTAFEAFRSGWPWGGFPWGRLAFSQVDSPLARLAPIGGTVLVSFVTAVVGTLCGFVIVRALRLRLISVSIAVVVAFVLLVAPLVVDLDIAPQDGTLRVGLVQGNVSHPGASAFDNAGEVLDNHLAGTEKLLDQVPSGYLDIVLWPENGSDYDPVADPQVGSEIDQAARDVGAPILVGAQQFPKTGGRYNVSLLWAPGQGVIDTYVKQHPVPFGEYIPLRSFVRKFSSAVDEVQTDMLPGHGPATITLPSARLGRDVTFANVICFEVAYDSLVTDAIKAGGEALVVPTNNASFGYHPESTQQLAMSRFRAMETSRATVQVSTVGVSAVISPSGVVQQETGLFVPAQLTATLPLRTDITPAVRIGAWPAVVVGGLAALTVVGGMIGGLRRRRRAPEREVIPT
jgi:apolipoprotein N-acyltransferase